MHVYGGEKIFVFLYVSVYISSFLHCLKFRFHWPYEATGTEREIERERNNKHWWEEVLSCLASELMIHFCLAAAEKLNLRLNLKPSCVLGEYIYTIGIFKFWFHGNSCWPLIKTEFKSSHHLSVWNILIKMFWNSCWNEEQFCVEKCWKSLTPSLFRQWAKYTQYGKVKTAGILTLKYSHFIFLVPITESSEWERFSKHHFRIA